MLDGRTNRRAFGGAAVWPVMARAQPPTMPVIGFLNGLSPEPFAPYLSAFSQGLGEAGYVDGKNVSIEFRWARGQYVELPALAADLVRRRASVIVTSGGTTSAIAAKAATADEVIE